MPLQHHDGLPSGCHCHGAVFQCLALQLHVACHRAHLAAVGRQHRMAGQQWEKAFLAPYEAECIAVHHDRDMVRVCLSYRGAQLVGCRFVQSDARTDACGLIGLQPGLPCADDGFGQCRLQDEAILLGSLHSEFACTAAQACFACQHGTSCDAAAPGHQQGVPHRSLVCIGRTETQQFGHFGQC